MTARRGGLIVAVVLASLSPASAAAQEARPLPVRVEPAEAVDSFLRERIYTGTLVAGRRSQLAFERAGKLAALMVDEGDRVSADQPLAQLDTRRITAQRARAAAELAEAESVLRELIAGPREQTIAAAQAEVRSLEAQRDVGIRRLRRRELLVETRAVSQEEYDEALFEVRAAEAQVDVAQKQLDELLAGTRIEQVDAQRARVQALRALLDDIDHEIEDATIIAPFPGRVVTRTRDEGAVVAAGESVFTVVEEGVLEAWVGLPPRSARLLEVGARIDVVVESEEYQARVKSRRGELDPQTRTQNVVLRIEQPGDLVPGQVVRIGVSEPVAMRGHWTPTASLTPGRRGLWSVLVVDDSNRVASREVEVIEAAGDRSFVRGALATGDRVIVDGAHRVVAGQLVDIVE